MSGGEFTPDVGSFLPVAARVSGYIADEETVAQLRRAIQRLALFDEPMIHKTAWRRAGFTDAQIATFGSRAVRYERLRRRTMRVTERQGEAA